MGARCRFPKHERSVRLNLRQLFVILTLFDQILVSSNTESLRTNFTAMYFSGFIASSACVHEIMQHADDVSKLLD